MVTCFYGDILYPHNLGQRMFSIILKIRVLGIMDLYQIQRLMSKFIHWNLSIVVTIGTD